MTIFKSFSMGGAGLGTWIFRLSSIVRIKAGKRILRYKTNALTCFWRTQGMISI
jgi:hypothetical protein